MKTKSQKIEQKLPKYFLQVVVAAHVLNKHGIKFHQRKYCTPNHPKVLLKAKTNHLRKDCAPLRYAIRFLRIYIADGTLKDCSSPGVQPCP